MVCVEDWLPERKSTSECTTYIAESLVVMMLMNDKVASRQLILPPEIGRRVPTSMYGSR